MKPRKSKGARKKEERAHRVRKAQREEGKRGGLTVTSYPSLKAWQEAKAAEGAAEVIAEQQVKAEK